MSEDFDFKPLTEGLGFHKKVIDISDELNELNANEGFQVVEPPPRKTPSEMPTPRFTERMIPVQSTPAVSRAAQAAQAAAEVSWTQPSSGATSQTPLSQIKNTKPQPVLRGAAASLGEEMFGLEFAKPLAKNLGQSAQVNDAAKQIKSIPYNVAASIFDAGMVVLLAGVFAWTVFFITQIEFQSVIGLIRVEPSAQIAAAVLLAAVFELYAIVSRVFFGRTFGEWALGVRLGTPSQQSKWWYPFAVSWRSAVVLITGLLTLPLLSTISRRDLAGTLSGVSLYQES